ncbi:MAG: MFS transporter [Bacillota bacterium]|jgi:predicted MFS family arabinose efflux permease|uniref:MFS transporter n=1 Tax=Bacillaceae TaxID=186817 RepID=UPI0013D246A2|nr:MULTISPECIES: MFS transporter [Bacillaceae]MCC3649536.1 MFS transporter [Cytobacillus oceanisediminis]MCU1808444.1 MFS transporter [Cytobacillus firmus]
MHLEKAAKETLWTKSFIMLMVGNLFVFMSFQMLIPTLPPYIKSIGATGLEIGLVTALFSIGAVLSRPFIGFMLEYKARKQLVLIGAAALLAITIIYPLSSVVMIFLLFRFIHGLAWGWSTTVNGTAAVDVVPNSRLGEGMGYYGLSVTIGMIIAPSLGIYLYQITSFTNLIFISSVLGVIAIVLLAIVRYETPEAVMKTRKEDLKFSYLGSLVEKSSWFPAFITILVTFGYGSIVTFIVIFGEERGIDQIFLFYLFNAIMASLSRPVAGKWFDQRGPMGLVLLCTFLTFIGMWVLSFAHSNLFIIISGILFGIGFGSLIPTLQSWTLSMTPSNRRGVANGMFFSSIDLGIGLSGLVFGVLAQFVETAALFQISSVFLILGMAVTVIYGKRRRAARPQQAS